MFQQNAAAVVEQFRLIEGRSYRLLLCAVTRRRIHKKLLKPKPRNGPRSSPSHFQPIPSSANAELEPHSGQWEMFP